MWIFQKISQRLLWIIFLQYFPLCRCLFTEMLEDRPYNGNTPMSMLDIFVEPRHYNYPWIIRDNSRS